MQAFSLIFLGGIVHNYKEGIMPICRHCDEAFSWEDREWQEMDQCSSCGQLIEDLWIRGQKFGIKVIANRIGDYSAGDRKFDVLEELADYIYALK